VKEKKNRKVAAPVEPPRRRMHFAVAAAALLGLAGAAVAGLYGARRRLRTSSPYADTAARVSLVELPAWLPDGISKLVTDRIQGEVGLRSVFEDDLARRVYEAAAKSPWISRVRGVAKHRDGRVAVQADFRRPFVLVRHFCPTASYQIVVYVVDEEGVLLPRPPRPIRLDSFIKVDGVAAEPPAPGQKWDAPDLTDALRLVKLIRDKPYVGDITLIDVRNHAGRIDPTDPHIVMVAQLGQGRRTDIRFGRFPVDEQDYCVGPAQKLAYLDKMARANGGHLAGAARRIELRYDRPYDVPY